MSLNEDKYQNLISPVSLERVSKETAIRNLGIIYKNVETRKNVRAKGISTTVGTTGSNFLYGRNAPSL
jgi:hypothetical protein